MTARTFPPILLALSLIAVSCAGTQPEADLEAAVKSRAAAYWQHRIKGELSKAYPYESPAMREGISLDTYYKAISGGLLYLSAKVKSAVVQEDQAVVIVEVRYKPVGVVSPKDGLKRDIRDNWQRYDGEWYHRFRPPKKKAPSDDM